MWLLTSANCIKKCSWTLCILNKHQLIQRFFITILQIFKIILMKHDFPMNAYANIGINGSWHLFKRINLQFVVGDLQMVFIYFLNVITICTQKNTKCKKSYQNLVYKWVIRHEIWSNMGQNWLFYIKFDKIWSKLYW